jgi:putative DNA primase/helicase
VLVLQGKQNIGKTSWIRSLDPVSCAAVREGAILDPANKDDVISVSRYWIVELGELDGTFRKSDIARLKAFITNSTDVVRAAYARKHSQLTRRTAFIATVNEPRFLVDDTGNRRWWTISVESINLNHGLDMQQVWAEAYHYWLNGEQPSLTNGELTLLNIANADYEQIDPLEEKVLEHFNWAEGWRDHQTIMATASEVLHEIGYKTPTKTEATRMGKILIKLTGVKPHRRHHVLPIRKIHK